MPDSLGWLKYCEPIVLESSESEKTHLTGPHSYPICFSGTSLVTAAIRPANSNRQTDREVGAQNHGSPASRRMLGDRQIAESWCSLWYVQTNDCGPLPSCKVLIPPPCMPRNPPRRVRLSAFQHLIRLPRVAFSTGIERKQYLVAHRLITPASMCLRDVHADCALPRTRLRQGP
jgi:hypothetical protein